MVVIDVGEAVDAVVFVLVDDQVDAFLLEVEDEAAEGVGVLKQGPIDALSDRGDG